MLQDSGSFGTQFELPEDKIEETLVAEEPQPIRRLSGIVIGDAVYAILEEDGQSTIVRPGSKIGDTDWYVASIDSERAVLRRDLKKRPNEVEVRLQFGLPQIPAGGAGGGAPGGAPGAGAGGGQFGDGAAGGDAK